MRLFCSSVFFTYDKRSFLTSTAGSFRPMDVNSIIITFSILPSVGMYLRDTNLYRRRFLVPSSYEGYGQVSFNYNIIKR